MLQQNQQLLQPLNKTPESTQNDSSSSKNQDNQSLQYDNIKLFQKSKFIQKQYKQTKLYCLLALIIIICQLAMRLDCLIFEFQYGQIIMLSLDLLYWFILIYILFQEYNYAYTIYNGIRKNYSRYQNIKISLFLLVLTLIISSSYFIFIILAFINFYHYIKTPFLQQIGYCFTDRIKFPMLIQFYIIVAIFLIILIILVQIKLIIKIRRFYILMKKRQFAKLAPESILYSESFNFISQVEEQYENTSSKESSQLVHRGTSWQREKQETNLNEKIIEQDRALSCNDKKDSESIFEKLIKIEKKCTCPICLEDIQIGELAYQFQCSHRYHFDCLDYKQSVGCLVCDPSIIFYIK